MTNQIDLLFFILEALSICFTVRRHSGNWQSPIIALFMTFLGRVIIAVILHLPSPLFECPLYLPLFGAIWILINCSPFDCVYKVLNTSVFVIACQFQSLLQARNVLLGVELAPSEFSLMGKALLGVILSSINSIVWLLFENGNREFSNSVILRNGFTAVFYAGICERKIVSQIIARQCCLVMFGIMTVIEIWIYGIWSTIGIDVTFLTHLGKFAHS